MQATSDKTASANFTQTGETFEKTIVGDVTGSACGRIGKGSLYYQWGRKDAFKSVAHGTASAAGITYSGTSVTVGKTMQNLTTLYNSSNGAYGDAYSPFYYNAWNAIATTYSAETTKTNWLETTVKTVYDPCPVGYTVPAANTFIAFSSANMPEDTSGKGRVYTSNGKKLFFHYAGRRNFPDANSVNYGTHGLYWTSISASADSGRHLRFSTTENVDPVSVTNGFTTQYRANGNTIRPVREN